MMISEIREKLNAIYPTVYYSWEIGNVPPLPYIVYYFPGNNDAIADNANYCKILRLNVELYTKEKDLEAEAKIEHVLNDMGLVYTRSESYLNSENMYEVLYESEVAINGTY